MATNIGTEPQDIPLNQFLGEMAFMDGPLRQLVKDDNKLEIDSSNNLIWTGNNVGINSDAPARTLDVYATSSTMVAQFKSGTSTNSSLICFANPASNADQVRIGSLGSDFIASTNYAERLRITSDGTVHTAMTGTAPSWLGNTIACREKFSVFQGANFAEACFNIDVDNSQTFLSHNLYYSSGWKIKKTGSPVRQLRLESNGFSFHTGSDNGSDNSTSTLSEKFRITSDGLVGIGTTNPRGLLTIRKQIEVSAAISNTNSHLSLVSDGGGSSAAHQSVLHFGPINGSTNTSPAAISAIASGNTASDLAFYVNSNNNYSQTPNTEVLRISSAGNVGIKKYPGSAYSLDIFGGFRVQGNIITKDYYKTGTTSEQQYTLRDTLANSSFEADPLSHPFLMNDLASFIARGGTVTFSGLTTAPGGLEQLFSTKGHVYFTNSLYSGSTFTITLTNLPRGLNYGTFFGATFGSAAFSPLSCKIETSTDGGGNWTTHLDHTGSQFNYFTKAEIGEVACNAIRYTIGRGTAGGVRIQNLWAFNYNSHGMEQYFMPRSGGELYGNMSFPSGNGIDFSANANAAGMTSELLDDYEEGTWTPEVRDNFSAGNLGSQDLAEGYYTKIGNKVDVWGRLSNINTSGMNSTFDFCMAGLPFTSTSSHTIVSGDVTTNFITFGGELGVRLEGGRSSIRLHETASGGNNDFVTISQLTSGTADMFMHITYFVD